MNCLKRLQSPQTSLGTVWPQPNLHKEAADEITRLREENARLEASNKKLNADLFKQAELTAVTMTRCADLMPAQSAIVKLKDQQSEIAELQKDIEYLKYKVRSLADALRPFANSADWKYGKYRWEMPIVAGANKDDLQMNLTLKDFRMAQMLIEQIDIKFNERKPK